MREPLYALSETYRAILEAMYDASDEEGVIPDGAIAMLQAAESNLADKAESCCRVLKQLEADAEAYKTEENRLKAKRQTADKQVEWLTKYVKESLEAAHLEKLETDTFTLKINKCPAALQIVNLDEIPEEFDTMPEREVSKEAIKAALKEGRQIPGAALIQNTRLAIK